MAPTEWSHLHIQWAWRERLRTLIAGLDDVDGRFVDASLFDSHDEQAEVSKAA